MLIDVGDVVVDIPREKSNMFIAGFSLMECFVFKFIIFIRIAQKYKESSVHHN